MHIAYFHQYFGTPRGAGGTRSYEMARALVEAGHDVTMVCASAERSATGLTQPFLKGRRDGLVDGIRVVEFDLNMSNSDGIAARTWKFLRFALKSIILALRLDYDLLFATSTPLTAAIPGIAAKLLRGKPFIFEVRDLWPELPRAMGMRNPLLLGGMSILEKSAYRCADKLIGLAPGIVDGIVRTGTPPAKVSMIPNGCDFDLFDGIDAVHASSIFPDAIRPGDFVAIFAGAHGRANGLDAVLDAAALIRERERGDIKLLLIGSGSEKPRLIDRVKREGLDNVILASSVPKMEVIGLIKGAGAGMQILANVPAFYEGTSPNKFFDYLSASRPVLINYPGWLARHVAEERCGIAVPPEDAAAFADALETLADNPALAEEMGKAASRLGRHSYDRALLAGRFVAVVTGPRDA